MADRFWRGGTGTWDTTNTDNWSTTSGGSGGASVPTSSDDVFLDTNSGGGTVTVNTDFEVNSVTMGAFTGTLDFATNNNSPIIHYIFDCSGSGTRTLNLGSGTFSGMVTWDIQTTTNLTFDAGTSTIDMGFDILSRKSFFNGGGLTYNNLVSEEPAGLGITEMTGSNTFNDITIGNNESTITFTAGTTTTIQSLTSLGTSGFLAKIESSTSGSPFTLSKASGTVNVSYMSIKDSTATGGALWIAKNSTDGGNNTGWNFVEGFLSVPTGSYTYTGINWLMKKVYVMLISTGTYAYTGINWLYGFPMRILKMVTGSYTYTGFNLGLYKTFRLAINTGVYIYTGFIDRLTKVFRLAINTGSYVYTGVNWSMGKAYRIIIETGVYVYKGFVFWKWKNTAKTVSNWVAGIKNSSVWSNNNKSSSTWTKGTKNSSTFTSQKKNSSIWTPEDKS